MATPKDILAVKRPRNTVVVTYGKERNLYAVRQRVGCRRMNGRNLPVTGRPSGASWAGSSSPSSTRS